MARARRLIWISVLAGVVYLVWRWRAQQAGEPGYLPGPAAPDMPGPAPRAPAPEQPPEPAAPPAAEAEAVTLRERAVGAAAPAEPEAPAAEEPAGDEVEGVDLAPLVGPAAEAEDELAAEPAGDEVEGVDLAPLVGPGAEAGGVDLAPLVGPTAALGAAGLDGPVNINTADLETLIALPGIGPALARRIVAYRKERGPFSSVDQLIDIQGIGPRNIDEFRHLITV